MLERTWAPEPRGERGQLSGGKRLPLLQELHFKDVGEQGRRRRPQQITSDLVEIVWHAYYQLNLEQFEEAEIRLFS